MGTQSPGAESSSIGLGWSLDLEIEPPPPPPPPPPVSTPSISSLAVTPAKFRAADIGGSIVSRRAPVGGTVVFARSDPGTASFSVQRLVPGVKRKGRCAKLKRGKKPVRRKSCKRIVRIKGGFSSPCESGFNGVLFTGRLRDRALAPGSYRLLARATADGATYSKSARTWFRIVR